MHYLLALENRSDYPRPHIGKFLWTPEHKRHVFEGRVLRNAEELADAVNAALPELQRLDNPYLKMTVERVAPPVSGAPSAAVYDIPKDKASRLKVKPSAEPALV